MFKKIALSAAALSAFVSAHAALPAGVEDAIDAVATDGTTLIAGMAIAGATVFLIYKLLKRFGVSL